MKTKTKKIVATGLFSAIIIVLQLIAGSIKLGPFSITLVLAPIVIGAALYGVGTGIWLGLVFGAAVLISGDAGVFLAINPAGTVATVLLKGILAGFTAAGVYKALSKKSVLLGVITAGIVCPVINTGVFLLGCRLFFYSTICQWSQAAGIQNAGIYMITVLVGANFLIELCVNLLLSSAIVKIIEIGKKSDKKTA